MKYNTFLVEQINSSMCLTLETGYWHSVEFALTEMGSREMHGGVPEVKNDFKPSPQKVVTVTYERWSPMRGSNYSDLTENCSRELKTPTLFQTKSVSMCCSRKYPYSPHGGLFGLNPPPLWKFQFRLILSLRIFNDPLWWMYGYFLKPHNGPFYQMQQL